MKLLELFSGTHSIGKVAKEYGIEVVSLDRDLGASHDGYTSDHHIKADIMTWDYKQFAKDEFDIITASPVCLFWSKLRNCWIGRVCKSIHPTDPVTKEHLQADIEKYGKPMVDKCFEIIEYFQPNYWWLENPQTGMMKDYIAERYPDYNTYYDVDYCKYSDWGYQKRTRFWTNIIDFDPKVCKKDCENIVEIEGKKNHQIKLANGYVEIDGKRVLCNTKERRQKIHKERMGTTKTVIDNGKIIRVNTKELREKYKDHENIQSKKHRKDVAKGVGGGTNRLDRYRIPPKLIKDLLDGCI